MRYDRIMLPVLLLFAQTFSPEIPRTWDEEALRTMEVPLAHAPSSPVHISAERYYALPLITVYKTYPLTMPGKTDGEYRAWLAQQEPEIVKLDAAALRSKEDWIAAGRAVFEAPTGFQTEVRSYLSPATRYVIRTKGKVEFGGVGCVFCHERHLDGGTVIRGAQFNLSHQWKNRPLVSRFTGQLTSDFTAPWLNPNPNELPEDMRDAVRLNLMTRLPATAPRFNSSPWSPPAVPDLNGIKDRKYLDRTGLVQHRGIGDLMRYAALNLGIGNVSLMSSYGGYVPNDHAGVKRQAVRFSDEQLYALALYIYSLEPPTSPHPFDATAAAGQKIFQSQGCANCHTPPHYTNNKLTPAPGFLVPDEHKKKYDIMPVSAGTDPWLTLKTRRGTGYYKIPSLKGIWYRGPFEHNGSVLTIEDWFDPARLRDDYVPTGWLGPNETRAVKGHEFGLKLKPEEKKALIAFLKTL